ncbi:MAG: phosphoribosylamine--glycine ligase [Atopococcus tabaci]|uniref:Phosphoribosylamine--glycine ligase n=1 Tax=Atopococcus tabaci TaxID=269774 RepID=A0AA43ZSW2_9LACT|nr:phosphoribosylamine--glycine ligase [Atopococcus tabaci]
MNILVIGSGGREHALAWKLAQSEKADKIYVAPGNAGTQEDFTNVAIDVMDFDALIEFSKENDIDLVVVGPEDPLNEGIVDRFAAADISIFGPDQACTQFESSKDFTKQFLNTYDIPTAASFTTTNYEAAAAFVETSDLPLVVKADGLCQGKGVIICETKDEAVDALEEMLVQKNFGDEGSTVVIEEFLEGQEQSLLCFVSNNKLVPMETAQDYKKIYEGEQGPNTGGVGIYSPSNLVTEELDACVEDILSKIEAGLEAEDLTFNGILFIGFMVKDNQPKVLEFNVRFGDPETEALMPRLESDLVEVMEKTLVGDLEAKDLKWSDQSVVGVVLYSEGYPAGYENNIEITHLPEVSGDQEIIFHNGTCFNAEGDLLTNGGRVLTILGKADTIEDARQIAYRLAEQVECTSLGYRKDIAEF